ncbi:hypothetical protein RB195_002752 [Necator americanus]|uniref:MARVEL domain-containing protein n=1 Tax=Necator americanus TaxID=51031 RepID=A0ABR1DKG8_NECAM
MRKTDSMGIERPTITNGNVMHQSMSFPEFVLATPVRLPRAIIRDTPPIRDISTSSESPIYQRHRVRTLDSSPYIGARALGVAPNAHNTVGPYWFPDHLSTRRPEEFPLSDIFNRQPISNQTSRKISAPANLTTLYPDQLMTDRLPMPTTSPIDHQESYFGENPHQLPRVALHSTDPLSQRQSPAQIVERGRPMQEESAVSSQRSSADDMETINARALRANPFLGYQRFMFALTKYPALVMTMIALWNITGRGDSMPKSDSEQGAFYAAFGTAGVVFASQILLSSNHYYLYKRARRMSYLYHLSMVVTFCGAVVCIVLASINFKNFRDNSKSTTECRYKNDCGCYSNQERLAYLSALAGGGIMLVVLAISTFIYGGIGLSLMKQRLAAEYAKKARERTYYNNGFQY